MPLPNIDIKRIKDRFSEFGNTSRKGDIDEELNNLWSAIDALVDYANTYEGKLYQSTKEHEGEYLYIGEDGKIATKVALMEDLPDFTINGNQIENGSITDVHICPGSLTGKHFEAGTFKNIPIGALQITQEHIGKKAIREVHIGEDITNEKLAKGAIGKDNLQSKIILPEHISDEGIPLRCLPEFGTAYYLQYGNEELERLIRYFALNNPENYSVVIENRGCYRFTMDADETTNELQNSAFINKLPNYVLSVMPVSQDNEEAEEALATLVRNNEQAEQSGYKIYSVPGLLDTTGDIYGDGQNTVLCYYYDDYFILPLSNQTFFPQDAKSEIDSSGETELFTLKVNKVQPVNNENNAISNFSNSGFVKIYISKNMDSNIAL